MSETEKPDCAEMNDRRTLSDRRTLPDRREKDVPVDDDQRTGIRRNGVSRRDQDVQAEAKAAD